MFVTYSLKFELFFWNNCIHNDYRNHIFILFLFFSHSEYYSNSSVWSSSDPTLFCLLKSADKNNCKRMLSGRGIRIPRFITETRGLSFLEDARAKRNFFKRGYWIKQVVDRQNIAKQLT